MEFPLKTQRKLNRLRRTSKHKEEGVSRGANLASGGELGQEPACSPVMRLHERHTLSVAQRLFQTSRIHHVGEKKR